MRLSFLIVTGCVLSARLDKAVFDFVGISPPRECLIGHNMLNSMANTVETVA